MLGASAKDKNNYGGDVALEQSDREQRLRRVKYVTTDPVELEKIAQPGCPKHVGPLFSHNTTTACTRSFLFGNLTLGIDPTA